MPLSGSFSSFTSDATSVKMTQDTTVMDEITTATVTFTIAARNIPQNSTLYWSTENATVNSADFTDSSLTGSVAIPKGTSNQQFQRTLASNIDVTGSNYNTAPGTTFGVQEAFSILLRQDSVSGNPITSGTLITALDTWGFAGWYGSYGTTPASDRSATFTVPPYVTNISYVCVGGGAGGGVEVTPGGYYGAGGGGALAYRNNVPVTPGQTVTIVAGRGGWAGTSPSPTALGPAYPGGASSVTVNGVTTTAGGGSAAGLRPATPPTYLTGGAGGTRSGTSTGGGNGGAGAGSGGGGGGGGGWSGAGGLGGSFPTTPGAPGTGGGGGGGGATNGPDFIHPGFVVCGGVGGGAGQRSDGAGGVPGAVMGYPTTPGGGDAPDDNGSVVIAGSGGGGGSAYRTGPVSGSVSGRDGIYGCVIIVWKGDTRQFPDTNIYGSDGAWHG